MAHRIEISYKEGLLDVPGEKLKRRIKSDLGLQVEKVHVVEVYTIDAALDPAILEVLSNEAFAELFFADFRVLRLYFSRSALEQRDDVTMIEALCLAFSSIPAS